MITNIRLSDNIHFITKKGPGVGWKKCLCGCDKGAGITNPSSVTCPDCLNHPDFKEHEFKYLLMGEDYATFYRIRISKN